MGHETDDAVVAALVEIVSCVMGIPTDKVRTDASFQNSLNIDSIGMLEVVLGIESRLQVSIPDAEIRRFADGSIEDAATWIRNELRLQGSGSREAPRSDGRGR
ncbi:acyl carrier protein [Amycolatopsis cihanbeyliensis]|uniref:Acyl carrier protein n=1 Tax=Amycolatopsis cihanbeyliensis TaxID=1128664 RepID=A0A542DEX1_AMYCI|nr:phosphopantetheine-binding protein [Amycolatopsis cihanbeyliensis]TQJ01619.1 acyl carrier protein [Amycolatopsis cihanbeyliensis]